MLAGSYDVVVLGFRLDAPEPPLSALSRIVGLDRERALELSAALPCAVLCDVSYARAESVAASLQLAGAHAKVVTHGARTTAALSAARAQPPPAGVGKDAVPSADSGAPPSSAPARAPSAHVVEPWCEAAGNGSEPPRAAGARGPVAQHIAGDLDRVLEAQGTAREPEGSTRQPARLVSGTRPKAVPPKAAPTAVPSTRRRWWRRPHAADVELPVGHDRGDAITPRTLWLLGLLWLSVGLLLWLRGGDLF